MIQLRVFNIQQLVRTLSLGLGLTLFYSCGTTKSTIPVSREAVSDKVLSRAELIEHLNASDRQWNAIKATTNVEVSLKGKSFSSKVNLSAVRGQGFELTVVPFPLIRVARVWINPSGLVLVDLINKRYAEVDYPTLSNYLGFYISYTQLEALLTGEVFVPGSQTPKLLEQLAFAYFREGNSTLSGKSSQYSYTFDIDNTYRLRSLFVKDRNDKPLATATYMGELGIFPSSVVITPKKVGESNTFFSLEWQKVTNSDPREINLKPIIKASYERIDISRIFEMLETK